MRHDFRPGPSGYFTAMRVEPPSMTMKGTGAVPGHVSRPATAGKFVRCTEELASDSSPRLPHWRKKSEPPRDPVTAHLSGPPLRRSAGTSTSSVPPGVRATVSAGPGTRTPSKAAGASPLVLATIEY